MFHHVIVRGINRRSLFDGEVDARRFLALLQDETALGEMQVHAYSLMSNHAHLLVRSIRGRLHDAMRRTKGPYAEKFNRGSGRTGTLFEGRYYSKPVRTIAHRIAVVRYLDRNPRDGGVVRSEGVYPYGSEYHYLRAAGPGWLTRSWVESVVRQRSGMATYSPVWYRRVFGAVWTEGGLTWFERFTASRELADAKMDAVIRGRPESVERWLRQRAVEGDGEVRRPPVVDARSVAVAVERCCEVAVPADPARVAGQLHDRRLVLAGLLRDLAIVNHREIGELLGISGRMASNLVRAYRSARETRAEIAELSSRCAREAIARCHTTSDRGLTPIGSRIPTGV